MRTVGLQAKVLTEKSSISALAGEWRALFSRCSGAATFQRPEWVLNWLDVFQPTCPHVIGVWDGSYLVGIAPLLIYQQNGQSVLAFAGGGVSDYLDMLIHPAHATDALAAIFKVIRAHRESFDHIEFTDLPQGSPLLNSGFHFPIAPHDTCAVLDLPSSLEYLPSVIPSHKLRNFRNSRRRLAEAGRFQVDVAHGSTVDDALANLFRLHLDRWEHVGQRGVLARRDIQQFHRQVRAQPSTRETLRLYQLSLSGVVIAMLYAFFESKTVYCYLQAYDPDYYKLSPGTFLLGTVIEDAVRHGASKIDFLRGRESYKLSWGAREVSTFRVRIPDSAL